MNVNSVCVKDAGIPAPKTHQRPHSRCNGCNVIALWPWNDKAANICLLQRVFAIVQNAP